jgi:hypothetical protein
MDAKTLDTKKITELEKREDRLAFECGQIMKRIGFLSMWERWLVHVTAEENPQSFWEDRLKEAWSAEATAGLTPEGRATYDAQVRALRSKALDLIFTLYSFYGDWDHLCDNEANCPDPRVYWQKQVDRLQFLYAEQRRLSSVAAAAAATSRCQLHGGVYDDHGNLALGYSRRSDGAYSTYSALCTCGR